MNKELYREYAALQAEIDVLETKQKALKFDILDEIRTLGPDKNGVETDFGSFTLQKKTVYDYSKVINDMEQNWKNRKKQEEQMGIAQIKSETEYVVFRPIKKF